MDCRNASLAGVAALSITAFLAAACSPEDPVTTLADLAARDDLRVQASVDRDVCQCPCAQIVCIRLTCGSDCSTADEYDITVLHGPESGSADCLPDTRGLDAKLFLDGAVAPIDATDVTDTCGQLRINWRGGIQESDVMAPHRVEMTDESGTWTIESPFMPRTATIIGPATAASPAPGETATLHAGESLVVALAPEAALVDLRATLVSAISVAMPPSTALEATITDAGVDIAVPSATTPGLYRVELYAKTALAPEACVGPRACSGLPVLGEWEVRVD